MALATATETTPAPSATPRRRRPGGRHWLVFLAYLLALAVVGVGVAYTGSRAPAPPVAPPASPEVGTNP